MLVTKKLNIVAEGFLPFKWNFGDITRKMNISATSVRNKLDYNNHIFYTLFFGFSS